jgi:hypothetical protein
MDTEFQLIFKLMVASNITNVMFVCCSVMFVSISRMVNFFEGVLTSHAY